MAFSEITIGDTGINCASGAVGLEQSRTCMLSDGTLIFVYRSGTSGNNYVDFAYSSDQGATWNTCATRLNYSTNNPFAMAIQADENDFIYFVGWGGSSGMMQAIEFTGTDIVERGSLQSIAAGYERGGIVPVVNPSNSDEALVLTCFYSGSTFYAYNSTFTYSTYSWTTATQLLTYSGASRNCYPVLRSTADDYRVPANSTNPEAYAMTWNGTYQQPTIRRFVVSSGAWTSSGSDLTTLFDYGSSYYGSHLCYDPSSDKYYVNYPGSSGLTEAKFIVYDPDASWGSPDNDILMPATINGLESEGQIVTDGTGVIRYWSADALGALTQIGYNEWDGTDFDTAGEVSDTSAVSLNSNYSNYGISHWVPGTSAMGVMVIEDVTPYAYGPFRHVMFIEWGGSGGAFSGWGIPMGIA